ncbi:transposable element Tcb2 transposase [Trichonephila clavipes]|nr:transposable element Tcb2 transposase [Trichonephila clavipes]
MTALRCVHILQPHQLQLMQRLPGAIFQQDNARPHTERVSQDCLRTVTTFPWPDRSPDLSPIEPTWVHLGRRVGHSTSLNELGQCFSNCGARTLGGMITLQGGASISKIRKQKVILKNY